MIDQARYAGTVFEFLGMEKSGVALVKLVDGQILFQSGDPADYVYMVDSGEIRLFDKSAAGKSRLLEILGPSDLFGLSALAMLPSYEKESISVGNSAVRAIPVVSLRKALAADGELALQFIQILALQLQNLWKRGGTCLFRNSRIRLIQKLIWFANSPAARQGPNGVELHITHEELAQAIGATRETVTLCLTGLRKQSLIETRRNCLVFDPRELSRLLPSGEPMPGLILAG